MMSSFIDGTAMVDWLKVSKEVNNKNHKTIYIYNNKRFFIPILKNINDKRSHKKIRSMPNKN